MHGLILAGGEGSRLQRDGIRVAKPLVEVGGRPQIVRLVETLFAIGCESVTCLVRDTMSEVEEVLRNEPGTQKAAVRWCNTPSSLHTLAEGFRNVPPGPVFCTMTDTVMKPADWRRLFTETRRALEAGADVVLAVTPYVDDERPLYVERNGQGLATRIGSLPTNPPIVTGGVYGWSAAIRPEADRACKEGMERMRAFLERLVTSGHRVSTVEIDRIIDLDGRRDLEQAKAWVSATWGRPAPHTPLPSGEEPPRL